MRVTVIAGCVLAFLGMCAAGYAANQSLESMCDELERAGVAPKKLYFLGLLKADIFALYKTVYPNGTLLRRYRQMSFLSIAALIISFALLMMTNWQ